MSGLVYFLECDESGVDVGRLGLGHLFPRGVTSVRLQEATPSGMPGVAFVDVGERIDAAALADVRWTPHLYDRLWVGLGASATVTARDLWRGDIPWGVNVTLAGDDGWMLPWIIGIDGRLMLPAYFAESQRIVTGRLESGARAVAAMTEAMRRGAEQGIPAQMALREGEVWLNDGQVRQLVAEALAVFHRVTAAEVDLLGLLDDGDDLALALQIITGRFCDGTR